MVETTREPSETRGLHAANTAFRLPGCRGGAVDPSLPIISASLPSIHSSHSRRLPRVLCPPTSLLPPTVVGCSRTLIFLHSFWFQNTLRLRPRPSNSHSSLLRCCSGHWFFRYRLYQHDTQFLAPGAIRFVPLVPRATQLLSLRIFPVNLADLFSQILRLNTNLS